MRRNSNKPKSKVRRAIKITLLAAVIVYLLIEHFTLSPQWCLSKERVWRAEEMDLTIYVAEDYETKLSECFSLSDRDELNKYVMGKMIIDGELYPFIFTVKIIFIGLFSEIILIVETMNRPQAMKMHGMLQANLTLFLTRRGSNSQ